MLWLVATTADGGFVPKVMSWVFVTLSFWMCVVQCTNNNMYYGFFKFTTVCSIWVLVTRILQCWDTNAQLSIYCRRYPYQCHQGLIHYSRMLALFAFATPWMYTSYCWVYRWLSLLKKPQCFLIWFKKIQACCPTFHLTSTRCPCKLFDLKLQKYIS